MSKQLLILFLALTPIFTLQGVTELTDQNFNELVKQDSSIWLVLFAADWVHYIDIFIVWPLSTFETLNLKNCS